MKMDYSTTYVYEIVCKDTTFSTKYLGYTTNFKQCVYNHKCAYKREKTGAYITMEDNGGFDNWNINVLQIYQCKDADEARKMMNNHTGYIDIYKPAVFGCDICEYTCSRKSHLDAHNKTTKHLSKMSGKTTNKEPPNEITNLVVELVKQNKEQQEQMTEIIKINQEQMKQTQQMSEIIKINQEQMKSSQEQTQQITEIIKISQEQMKSNQQIQTRMIDICNRPTQVNNTTNNNSFCLNVFLNETCKDAIDMDYFIDNMVVTVEEIMRQANTSFEDGFAAILKDRLCDKMSITERPIHFTDTKRETIIYKDKEKNEWVRDENQTIPTEMCRGVTKQMSKYVCENRHLLPNHIFDNVMMNSWPANEKQRSKVMRTIMPYLCVPKEGTHIGNKTQFSSAK